MSFRGTTGPISWCPARWYAFCKPHGTYDRGMTWTIPEHDLDAALATYRKQNGTFKSRMKKGASSLTAEISRTLSAGHPRDYPIGTCGTPSQYTFKTLLPVMTWIILQFVFLAMPVVLPALLYRSRRYFMARFYDKMIWSEKARRLYAHVLLIVLLLFHYVIQRTPRRVRCCAIDHRVCRIDLFPAGGADGCAVCLTGRNISFWFTLWHWSSASVPHLYTMSVTIAFILLAALFYPSARVMYGKTDMRKFLEWLEYPGALADSYHSIITRDCHDNADNGGTLQSARYESSKTERK